MAEFSIDWRLKDFQIRTTHPISGKRAPYVELVKWDKDDDGDWHCFALAYWHRYTDGAWELRFVGGRPFEYIAGVDIGAIWKQLFLIQQMFMDAEKKGETDG